MSRLGITFEEVALAAADIQAQGQAPTIDKIRHYLGGTGSNTTISKYLSQWRREHFIANVSPRVEAQQPIPDIVKSAVDKVWQEIKDQAESEVSAAKSLAEEQINTANAQVAMVEQSLASLQEQQASLTESFNHLQAEKELLILDIKSLKAEHQELQQRYGASQDKIQDIERLTSHHLLDLRRAKEEERKLLAEQFAERAKSLQEIVDSVKEQAEKERHLHMVEMDSAITMQQKLQKLADELKAKQQQLVVRIEQQQFSLDAAEKERDQAKQLCLYLQNKFDQLVNNVLIPSATFEKMTNAFNPDRVGEQLSPYIAAILDEHFIEFKDWLNKPSPEEVKDDSVEHA